MGTLKIKIFSKHQKNIQTVNYWSNYVVVHEKQSWSFSVPNWFQIFGTLKTQM